MAAVGFGKTNVAEVETTEDLRKVVTVSISNNKSLDQTIWEGISRLKQVNPALEYGKIEILMDFGDSIHVTANLKTVDLVLAGNLSLRDYIREHVIFQ